MARHAVRFSRAIGKVVGFRNLLSNGTQIIFVQFTLIHNIIQGVLGERPLDLYFKGKHDFNRLNKVKDISREET